MDRPSALELLTKPDALLNRSHLRELGLERRAVDAVFRALPVVVASETVALVAFLPDM
jgi:hypothetical protein